MIRFYGHKDYKAVSYNDPITEGDCQRFYSIYGETISLVFSGFEMQTYDMDDIRNRQNNGLNKLLPDDELFKIIDLAMEIFLKSGKTLVYMYGKAEELEVKCEKHNIIMVFVEHSAKLKKQIAKVKGDMDEFLAKIKPLPKRIDFRGYGRKSKRTHLPVFDMLEGYDFNGWPIKVTDTASEIQDEKADILAMSIIANDSAPVIAETSETLSTALNMIDCMETSEEYEDVPKKEALDSSLLSDS